MEITVRYFTVLRRLTEKKQEKINIEEDSTLQDILALLIRKYGETFERYISSEKGKKRVQMVFLLNGQDIAHFDGLKTTLHNGDTITLMPPIAGG